MNRRVKQKKSKQVDMLRGSLQIKLYYLHFLWRQVVFCNSCLTQQMLLLQEDLQVARLWQPLVATVRLLT